MILTTQTFSRRSSAPVLATRNAASLLAMLPATRTASRYTTRYSQSHSQHCSLAKVVGTCNSTRNSQNYSLLPTLFATLLITRGSTRYCLLATRNATHYSIFTIRNATRHPQRSSPLATLLEDYPNPWKRLSSREALYGKLERVKWMHTAVVYVRNFTWIRKCEHVRTHSRYKP